MKAYFDGPREARRFTEFVHGPKPKGVAGFASSKANARRVADACGVRAPQMLATFAQPDAVSFANLPDRFVLKPNSMASRRGVYLLSRRSGTEWFDTFTQRLWTEDAVRRTLAAAFAQKGAQDMSALAEEWVIGENGPDQIPFDYKMFAFDGSVELIVQIDRNHPRTQFAFFQRDFEPLDDHLIELDRRIDRGTPRRPANWQAMIDASRRISEHLDVPFIRVDLYSTGTEVLLGELTPRPGGAQNGQYRLSDTLDGELGAYWRLALRRRGASIPQVTGLPPVLEDERNFRRTGPLGWLIGKLQRRSRKRHKARLAASKAAATPR